MNIEFLNRIVLAASCMVIGMATESLTSDYKILNTSIIMILFITMAVSDWVYTSKERKGIDSK